MSLPPIDCALRDEIDVEDGVETPDGRLFESVNETVADPLAAGIVIDDALTPAMAPNVTVVGPLAEVVVLDCDDWVVTVGVLLPPPPPHAASPLAKTTPIRTDDKRSTR